MPRHRGTRQSLMKTAAAAAGTSSSLLTDLVAHWKLNESSGNRADSHGSSTLSDGVGFPGGNTGKIGDAADFDVMFSQALTCADNAALSMGDIDFTVTAWVYMDSKTADMDAVCKGTSDASGREYRLYYSFSDDRFAFAVSNGSSETVVTDIVLGSPSTGTWYFLQGEHNATANTITLRINNSHSSSQSHTVGSQDSGNGFAIGRSGGSASSYWDGRIDSVSIWKRVLTVDERTALYAGGSGLDYPFS